MKGRGGGRGKNGEDTGRKSLETRQRAGRVRCKRRRRGEGGPDVTSITAARSSSICNTPRPTSRGTHVHVVVVVVAAAAAAGRQKAVEASRGFDAHRRPPLTRPPLAAIGQEKGRREYKGAEVLEWCGVE
jgi:hypothetical protein